MLEVKENKKKFTSLKLSATEIIDDYRLACQSRQASLLGRREVMGGKAKFGIFGDGKEVPQLALAHSFKNGDYRSGYYRDQTLILALKIHSLKELFAQLYAAADVKLDPASAGRAMNSHFGNRMLDEDGNWMNVAEQPNTSSDISPTASQMPRLVGLAYASKLYREIKNLRDMKNFSKNGNEIAFGTIGNASCAEGMFWEAVNAIGVLKVPAIISIWDDEYGISVHNSHQITKQNLSEVLSGFQRKGRSGDGFEIFTVKAWDYPALVDTYRKASDLARKKHIPCIVHVIEVTQPQGHSTSGSHERYKSAERLQWEQDFDCLTKMRQWIITEGITGEAELDGLEAEVRQEVEKIRDEVWNEYLNPIRDDIDQAAEHIESLATAAANATEITAIANGLRKLATPFRRDISGAINKALLASRGNNNEARMALLDWKRSFHQANRERYNSSLHSEGDLAATAVTEIPAQYADKAKSVPGFEILNACFDKALTRDPRIIAFGEDVGQLGDVNQGFKGMQERHGELRVSDTGIRECTIIGQAIGMAMRGLRPIAEIQYLDYILYALQIMSDDLATLRWRTKGGQKAPVIVRTRGHRLEGIWHAGSPMAGIIHLLRGMHVLVPRNMTQAAGFYNTLLKSDEPALIVEVLNAYRLREPMPENIGEFTIPLGVPEVLRSGKDITLVTYAACCPLAESAAKTLAGLNIDLEIIDVRSLLPFDTSGIILESLKKTSRIIFLDEDVPGGTTAYMMQEVLEKQGGYQWLDSQPTTISAKAHRPAYGSDGDYWSKPNVEEIVEAAYGIMHEFDPQTYPALFE